MSADPSEEPPEERVDTEDVGGLEEILPPQLLPIWSRLRLIQEFRDTHGQTYVSVAEAIIGIALAAGYLYWLTLYFGG